MKKTSILLFTMSTAAVHASDIYTGSETGSYFRFFGPAISEVIKEAMFNYQVVKTNGTGDNLERLDKNPSSIALAQLDIANDLISKTPGWRDKMEVVRSDLGTECLFAVTNNPKLTSWAQVQQFATRVRVATGAKTSGSYLTLQNLQAQDEMLKGLDNKLQNANDTLGAIQAVQEGKADLAFFVQVADTKNPIFETINANQMSFIPVADRSFLRLEINGQKVYEMDNVKVTPSKMLGLAGAAKSITTACTKVAIVTGKPEVLSVGAARKDQQDLIAALKAVSTDKIRPHEPFIRQAIDNTTSMAESAIGSLLEEIKSARSPF